jgi:hypothetical protein
LTVRLWTVAIWTWNIISVKCLTYFIYRLFNDVTRSDCIAINDEILHNFFVVYFTTLSVCSPGLGKLRSRRAKLRASAYVCDPEGRLCNIL